MAGTVCVRLWPQQRWTAAMARTQQLTLKVSCKLCIAHGHICPYFIRIYACVRDGDEFFKCLIFGLPSMFQRENSKRSGPSQIAEAENYNSSASNTQPKISKNGEQFSAKTFPCQMGTKIHWYRGVLCVEHLFTSTGIRHIYLLQSAICKYCPHRNKMVSMLCFGVPCVRRQSLGCARITSK